MLFGPLNFTLDLVLLTVMAVLVVPDKPVRVTVVTFLYLFSFLCPMTLVENGFHSRALPPPSDTSKPGLVDPGQAADLLARTDNALEGKTGDAAPKIEPAGRSSHPGMDSGLQSYLRRLVHPIPGQSLRYGRGFTATSAEMVERLWFYARICALFALIPFFIADPRVTLGIASLLVLPVPYLCVLILWLRNQVFPSPGSTAGPEELPPGLFAAVLGLGLLVIGMAAYAWWLPRSQRTEVFVPDPGRYRVKMTGQWFDFVIDGTTLRLLPGEIELDLSRASSAPGNVRCFRFLTGTEIEFTLRTPEKPLPKPEDGL